MQELEERLEKSEREIRKGLMDMDDLYLKTRKLYGRMVKQLANEQEEETPEAPGPEPGVPQAVLDPISARILARRRRIVGGEAS